MIYEHPLINDEPNSPPPLLFITVTFLSALWKTPSAYVHGLGNGGTVAGKALQHRHVGQNSKDLPWSYTFRCGLTYTWRCDSTLGALWPSRLSCKTPPRNGISAPPRPPASQQEEDQSESRAVNPPPYRLTTGPKPPWLSTHSLLMEVIRRGSRTQANLKEANVETTAG